MTSTSEAPAVDVVGRPGEGRGPLMTSQVIMPGSAARPTSSRAWLSLVCHCGGLDMRSVSDAYSVHEPYPCDGSLCSAARPTSAGRHGSRALRGRWYLNSASSEGPRCPRWRRCAGRAAATAQGAAARELAQRLPAGEGGGQVGHQARKRPPRRPWKRPGRAGTRQGVYQVPLRVHSTRGRA